VFKLLYTILETYLMKKFLYLIVLLPFFAHAQSLKNLDIKNGFLKFHLGDNLSVYSKDIYVANEKHPNEHEIKETSLLPLNKYLERAKLISEKGIVVEIDLYIRDEASIRHIDQMITNTYSAGNEIPNPDKDVEGTNLVCTTWTGDRVLLMMMQHNINHVVNGHMTRGRIQALLFKKTSDAKVDGTLPDGFAL
jgi:hypothetical protein